MVFWVAMSKPFKKSMINMAMVVAIVAMHLRALLGSMPFIDKGSTFWTQDPSLLFLVKSLLQHML